MDDVKIWLTQEWRGSAETALAPFWRLHTINPSLRIVTVRRPVAEIVKSLLAIDLSGVGAFSAPALEKNIARLDAKLTQLERRLPNVVSVKFHDLGNEETVRAIFAHCLPYAFDKEWWLLLRDQNLQCNMRAITRYAIAYKEPLQRMAATAAHQCRAQIMLKPPKSREGVTIQQETFADWERDGVRLFEAHCVEVGESPDNWKNKNAPLMRKLYEAGALQITTARSNGRMFGYLVAIISPSLEKTNLLCGVHTTFYVSKDMPGLSLKLQRASIAAMSQKGVTQFVFHQGVRAEGPRMDVLYRRLGAEEFGHLFRLNLDII